MFKLLKKVFTKTVTEPIDDYSLTQNIDSLKDDINLIIRTKYREQLYESYVESIDEKEILFRAPIDTKEIIRFNINSIINIELVSYLGLYTSQLFIYEKFIKDNVLYYKAVFTTSIQEKQRRKHYRLPIELGLEYKLIGEDNKTYICTGNTVDLSISGMLMESQNNLTENDSIKILFNITGIKDTLEGIIIKRRVNYKNDTYLYNIKFNNLSNSTQKKLHKFIMNNKI